MPCIHFSGFGNIQICKNLFCILKSHFKKTLQHTEIQGFSKSSGSDKQIHLALHIQKFFDKSCFIYIVTVSYTHLAVQTLGAEFGALLSFLYTEVRGLIVFAYENRLFDMTVVMELFVQVYNLFEEEEISAKDVKEAVYWYVSDYSDEMVGRRVQEMCIRDRYTESQEKEPMNFPICRQEIL